jgi:hypothetical protein
MSPSDSKNLTYVVEPEGSEFVVYWSPPSAEHDPEYVELTSFPTRGHAKSYLATP